MQKPVKIIEYNNSMKSKVLNLFVIEYCISAKESERQFNLLYENEIQIHQAVKLVAVIQNKVIGFQSFFYWPYKKGHKKYHSFQSGNSIVDPDFRGKGIFSQLLKNAEKIITEKNIDFILGFPVSASLGSFLRRKWLNEFNLQWYIKPISINPIIFFKSSKKLNHKFNLKKQFHELKNLNYIVLDNSKLFIDYRDKLNDEKFYFKFEKEDIKVEFSLKLIIRKKIFREIIIGRVDFNFFDEELMSEAFFDLIQQIKRIKKVNYVSFAISGNSPIYDRILKTHFFRKIKKEIFFIHKKFKPLNFDNLLIYRSDIDTW